MFGQHFTISAWCLDTINVSPHQGSIASHPTLAEQVMATAYALGRCPLV
jgi:hypothetical protein